MKTAYKLFAVLLVLALLTACGATEAPPTEAPKPEPTKAEAEPTKAPEPEPTEAVEEPTEAPPAPGLTCDEPIKVGVISDLTGPLAVYGAHIERSFKLGIEYATGDPGTEDGVYMLEGCEVHVIWGDDQTNPENTATVAREMIEVDGVDIIVGTVSSGATATLQEIAKENDVVHIAAPAAANDITGVNFSDHTFRTSRNNYQDAVNLCEYLVTEYDTFVQIAPDYSFGWGGAQAFRDACTSMGGEFVADDIFAPADTTDFTPYMEQILDSGADAWIVTWAGGGFIPMMQAAVDLGVMDEMDLAASFIDNISMPAFFANAIGTTSGILYHYTSPDNEINDWLVAETMARHDTPPDLFDADGMNAAIMVIEALKATGGDASSAALIPAMEGMAFEGPKGTVDIRAEDHVAIQDMYIVTLKNVDDANFEYFEQVKTNRPAVPCLLPEDMQDRCGDLPVGALGEIAEPVPELPTGGLNCDEPIKVGVISDLTGPLAVYGAHIERSFKLGMEYMTGDPGTEDGVYNWLGCDVQVIWGDDQTNPENTATVAREMIEVDDVDIIVGTVSSGATATLQEIAKENNVVHIAAPAAANDITGINFSDHTFRTSRNNYQDAVNLCEYLVTQYDTFVQIAPDYSFGWGGAQAFRDACTSMGGEFVADDIFAPADTTDFTPYMEQILDSGADAWIVTWAGGGFIPMMQAAVDLGVMDEMDLAASFIDNISMPAFFANAIGTTSGILYHYTSPDNEINDWLVAETMARHNTPPDLFDADGMNAAIMVLEGIVATSGDASAEALIPAFEGMSFEGPKGTVDIRAEDHVAIQDMYIVTLKNVDDPEFKYFEQVKTNRPAVPCLLPEDMQDRCGDLPVGALGKVPAEPAEPPPAAALTCDEPIKVGVISDLTGPLAVYGAHIERSFKLGMEYATGAAGTEDGVYMIDDCEVHVIWGDDQTNPENTATVAREMIEVDDVDIIVGTVSSGATATLQEIAKENDVVHIAAPAAANDITGVNFSDHTFRTSRNNYQDAVNLCEYLVTQYDTFVQIAPDYSFGWGGAQAFRDACTSMGGEFVTDDIFAPADTTDFTPYMEQILDSGADAWIVTWAGGGFIPMMQAAVDLGVMDEMDLAASFIDNISMPAFFANAIGTTSGILYHYTSPDNAINDWLVTETIARHNTPPDLFDADGMNAAIMVVESLKATGGDASAATLIPAMEGMAFEGPKGTVDIRAEDHVAIQDMYIVTLKNVDDANFEYFEQVKTNRPNVPCLLPEDMQDRCGDLPIGSLGGE